MATRISFSGRSKTSFKKTKAPKPKKPRKAKGGAGSASGGGKGTFNGNRFIDLPD